MYGFLIAIGTSIVYFIIQAIAAVGVGFVVYSGLDLLFDNVKDFMLGYLTSDSLPLIFFDLFLLSGLDIYFSIVVSATMTSAAVGASGVVKKLRIAG